MSRTPFLLLLSLTLSLPASWPARAQSGYVGCLRIQQITREECDGLETLFRVTNGPDWFNHSEWLATNEPCEWFGVTCSNTPWPRNVTKIHLVSNNLAGPLPGEISRFTELTELVIDNSQSSGQVNVLTGAVPIELWELKNLEVIILSNHDLVGSIPPELGRLPRLRVLHLDDNDLSGPLPAGLAGIPTLERLDVSGNNLGGLIPPELGVLDSLAFLDLSNNLFTGPIPPELGTLEKLTWLDLSSNGLTGPIPATLTHLGKLFRLNLDDNDLNVALSPSVAAFAAGLTSCSFENNPPALCIPDTTPYQTLGVDPICGLSLDASCSLCASAAGVSETECGALETLYLGANGLGWTDQAGWLETTTPCDWFGVTCTDGAVTALALPQNNLDGSIPPSLSALSNMSLLDLSGNNLQGTIPQEVGTLTSLTTLDLSSNQMTGDVPLAVAEIGAAAATCNLADNDPGLCIPDTPPFRALGVDPLCGLPLSAACVSPLLVEIVSFEAAVEGEAVVLTWTTDRSTPDVRFDVERKAGEAFERLGVVEGSAEATPTFTFRVTGLARGTHTFRLKQVDVNGSFQYSDEVTVVLVPGDVVVESAFPNPFRATTTLRFAVASEQEIVAELYDVMGRRVQTLYAGIPTANAMQTLRIDGNGLPSGLYVVRITGAGGFSTTEMVLLLK